MKSKSADRIKAAWNSFDLLTQVPILDPSLLGKTVRKLPFYTHLGKTNEWATIIKIGRCNFSCPYCFRYKKECANKFYTSLAELLKIGLASVDEDRIVRLSGGDPVTIADIAVEMARFFKSQHGQVFDHGRVALAHNGSSPHFVKRIAPFLEMIALDIKATPDKYAKIIGLSDDKLVGRQLYKSALESIKLAIDYGLLTEIRTPIFGFTTIEDLCGIAKDLDTMSPCNKTTFWTLRFYNTVPDSDFLPPLKEEIVPHLHGLAQSFRKLNIGLRFDTIDGEAIIERL